MAGKTITGLVSTQVYLDSYSPSYLSVSSTGTLQVAGIAVTANAVAGTVVNYGSIYGTGSAGIGIDLFHGGFITNKSGGHISGASTGAHTGAIVTDNSTRVVNDGAISGGDYGIDLLGGGTIINHAGGTISGSVRSIYGDLASVYNAGSIGGGAGVYLRYGALTNASGGMISNTAADAVVISGFSASVGNSGTITAATYGVLLQSTGTITNTGVIGAGFNAAVANGFATVTNSGGITGENGVYLKNGGSILNQGSGTISGTFGHGILVIGAAASVANYGHVSGHATSGIYLQKGGTVVNGGSILSNFDAVRLGQAGFVSNQAAGYIGGKTGIDAYGTPATIDNAGVVYATNDGIYLFAGGSITNESSGYIHAVDGGIGAQGASVSIFNHGTIVAGTSAGSGAAISSGGYFFNDGSINGAGGDGILFFNVAGRVVNAGSIHGAGDGVALDTAGSSVLNKAGGVINGGSLPGVYLLASNSTLENAGSISGHKYSVGFGFNNTNLLIVDPGASFGEPASLGGATGTIELASAASTGTLSGIGSQFVNFGTVTIASGASWKLTGDSTLSSQTTLASSGTLINAGSLVLAFGSLSDTETLVNNGVVSAIDPSTLDIAGLTGAGGLEIGASSNFTVQGTVAAGETVTFIGSHNMLSLADPAGFAGQIDVLGSPETIALTGITHDVTDSATVLAGNTLQVITDVGTFDLKLDPAADFSHFSFPMSAAGSNDDITVVACYAAGTNIRTMSGEVPVEALRIGDLLPTRDGTPMPIKWIGHRAYAAPFVAANRQLQPVRVCAGALGDKLPRRDLFVSPQHALHFEDGTGAGVLVPAAALVNGTTIQRCPDFGSVRYFHVELEQHRVIYAEGVAAETFLDCDSRAMFANAAEYAALYCDAAAPAPTFCAPRLEQGHALEALRCRLGPPRPAASCGPLQGHIERVIAGLVEGWALDTANPHRPVELELLTETGATIRILANRYRADLDHAGIAGGRCGFTTRLQGGAVRVRLRRAADGAILPQAAA